MKTAWTGIESSGKSLQLAVTANRIFKRNVKWLKITKFPRTMAFDSPMSVAFVNKIKASGLKYVQFRNLHEILPLDNTDIFINEALKYFPANGSMPLSAEQMDFLTQGAKNGVDIYCASQDFSQVHKQFRLLMNKVFLVSKVIGSRRPVPSAPPVRAIWGLLMIREVAPSSFKGDSASMQDIGFIPSFAFIHKDDCDLFDTSFKVPLSQLPDKRVRKQRVVGYNDKNEVEYEKVNWV